MLSFWTIFALDFLFKESKDKSLLALREQFSDKDWWEYHTSFLYSDVENECVKKWAAERGYDLKADENIIKTQAYRYIGYGEVLELMLERAKEKKKTAKSRIKRKEAKLLIKMIKKYQNINKGYTR